MISSAVSVPGLPIVLVVLALIFTFQPWWLPEYLWPYDYARWVETFFLMAISGLSLIALPAIWHKLRGEYLVAFGLFCALTLAACWMAESGWLAYVGGLRAILSVFFIFVMLFSFPCLPARQRRLFALAFLAVLGLHLLYSLMGMVVLMLNRIVGADYLISGFSNKNHAVTFYVPCLLLLPAFQAMLGPESMLCRLGVFILGVLLALMILVIGARGGILSLLASLAFLAIAGHGGQKLRYMKWVLYCFLTAALGFWALQWIQSSGLGEGVLVHQHMLSDSRRLILWERAWEGFLSAPWFGHGPLSYALNRDLHVTHPHNILLLLLYEYGILSVLLCGLIIWSTARELWHKRVAISADPISFSGVAAVTAFLAHAMVGAGPMVPVSMLIFGIAVAFALSSVSQKTERVRLSVVWRPSGRICMTIIAGAGLIYILLVAKFWAGLPEDGNPEPRFWQYGEIALPWPEELSSKPDNPARAYSS